MELGDSIRSCNIAYLREASALLLVQLTGQCESLKSWNE